MNDLDALFNSSEFEKVLDIDSIMKEDEKENSYSIIYRPSLKKAGVDKYVSVVKFLPYYKNPNLLWTHNYEIFLKNATDNSMRTVNCPSTIGQPSVLQDAFFECYNSDEAVIKRLKGEFSRSEKWYSIVQIIKDDHDPDLVGKIMIFKYGKQIYDKLKASIQPTLDGIDAMNPFNPIEGKHFALQIKTVDKYPNYNDSQFMSKTLPGLIIDGKEVLFKDDPEKVKTFLQENTPDLEAYKFQPWDAETKKFVAKAVISHFGGTAILDKLMSKYPDIFSEVGSSSTPTRNTPAVSTAVIDDDDDDLDNFLMTEEVETKAKTKAKATPVAKKTEPEVEKTSDDDDLFGDDFFDDMG